MPYAEKTTVPVHRTREEIRAVLTRAGATAFSEVDRNPHHERGELSVFAFDLRRKCFRFRVLPPAEREYRLTDNGRIRGTKAQEAARQQLIRARWRALLLFVRAACEASRQHAMSIEDSLLPWVVLEDGRTLAERAREVRLLERDAPAAMALLVEGAAPSGPRQITHEPAESSR